MSRKIIPLILLSLLIPAKPAKAEFSNLGIAIRGILFTGALGGACYGYFEKDKCRKKLELLEKLKKKLGQKIYLETLSTKEAKRIAEKLDCLNLLEDIIKREETKKTIEKNKKTNSIIFLASLAAFGILSAEVVLKIIMDRDKEEENAENQETENEEEVEAEKLLDEAIKKIKEEREEKEKKKQELLKKIEENKKRLKSSKTKQAEIEKEIQKLKEEKDSIKKEGDIIYDECNFKVDNNTKIEVKGDMKKTCNSFINSKHNFSEETKKIITRKIDKCCKNPEKKTINAIIADSAFKIEFSLNKKIKALEKEIKALTKKKNKLGIIHDGPLKREIEDCKHNLKMCEYYLGMCKNKLKQLD